MTWNYRVTVHTINSEELWEVRELYYTNGKVTGWTQEAIALSADSHDEITESLKLILEMMKKPSWDLDKGCWVDRDRKPWNF